MNCIVACEYCREHFRVFIPHPTVSPSTFWAITMATLKVPLRFTDGTVKELDISSTTTVADLKAQLGVRVHYAQNCDANFAQLAARVFWRVWCFRRL